MFLSQNGRPKAMVSFFLSYENPALSTEQRASDTFCPEVFLVCFLGDCLVVLVVVVFLVIVCVFVGGL